MKKQLLLLYGLICINIIHAQIVTTVAGTGATGSINGNAITSTFYNPTGVCTDSIGNIFIADNYSNKIRKITPAGIVSTFAGGSQGSNDGTGAAAKFFRPDDLCMSPSGDIFVTDCYNHKIRKITPGGIVTTFAGSGNQGASDGMGTSASFRYPQGICIDLTGNIYVADFGNNKIRKITPSGVVSTYAGSGNQGSLDGVGSNASFDHPIRLCIDISGNIYVADSYSNKIRKITPGGVVLTYAGTGNQGSADGSATTASFYFPAGICIDAAGNLYVADAGNHKIRKISVAGVVSSYAGSGTQGSFDGIGLSASFKSPFGIRFDFLGNIIVADQGNHKIRKISNLPSSADNYNIDNKATCTVYPNPSNGLFTIENKETIKQITLTDITGRAIFQQPITDLKTQIDISDFKKGMYFLNAIDDNKQINTIKIIIQ